MSLRFPKLGAKPSFLHIFSLVEALFLMGIPPIPTLDFLSGHFIPFLQMTKLRLKSSMLKVGMSEGMGKCGDTA
jgi:hypothetical protein